MIRFLSKKQLETEKKLKHDMHLDRAHQFYDRLKWDVKVNNLGEEKDEYDDLNPLYVVSVNDYGQHQGSLRLLPTTGQTMVNDHFLDITNGVKIVSPHIWECTRFCISKHANTFTATRLLAAGAYLMRKCCVDHFVGVFDQKMQRIYRFIGASPTIIGSKKNGHGTICLGLWEFEEDKFDDILKKAKLSIMDMDLSFAADTGQSKFAVRNNQRIPANLDEPRATKLLRNV